MPTPYLRRMVILQEEQTGYRADASRPCAGRVLLEATGAQGKATVSVQNLCPDAVYTFYIIETDAAESIGIPLGSITALEHGKATVRLLFDAGAEAAPITDKTVVALIVKNASPSNLVAPLVGAVNQSASKNVVWRGNFKEYVFPKSPCGCPEPEHDADTNPEPTPESTPVAEPMPAIETNSAAKSFPATDAPNAQTFFSVLQTAEPNASARFADTVAQFIKSGEICADEPIAAATSPSADEANEGNEDDREGALDIWYLFDTGTPVHPFAKQNADVQWVQIGLDELKGLPFRTQQLAESEFVQKGYNNFGHLLLGKLSQGIMIRFILGVPGVYDEQEHRMAARLGFRQFKTTDDSPAAPGTRGYWLLIL